MLDLVIRGGSVADGRGGPRRTADVGIADGKIVVVGPVDDDAAETVDADGALVTPGFVDVHTHYDGQATWDRHLQPSSGHGVTTIVMGNCGVGFAPVRPSDHSTLIELMEGVEDIPGTALHEGLPWDWHTIADYLDALDRRPHDIDYAAQVCHGPVRLFVMGERGANREPATADEIDAMGRIVADGIRAGALGFTTSRTINHRTSRGEPTPTLTAARDELVGIARAVGDTGAGVLQVVSDFPEFDDEATTLLAMMRASRRPLSFTLSQGRAGPGHQRLLDVIARARAEGSTMRGQVAARAIGVCMTLQGTINPLSGSPTFRDLQSSSRSFAELVARLVDPATRHTITAELVPTMLDQVYELGDPPDYEPDPSTSIAARAARLGVAPVELLYDLLLGDDGHALLYWPVLNYGGGNLDAVGELLAHPHTIPGLSDGGAHVGTICDASFPTTLLAHWGRDRTRGRTFDVEWLVQQQCRATAEALGLRDRGILAPGYKADVNVIDFENLGMRRPRLVFDLPAGGKRLVQDSTGYLHTFVSGVEVARDGRPTGATPGRLVRGSQRDPS